MSDSSPCHVCAKPTSTRCSGCRQLFFCSTACQKLLFPNHKYICKKEDQSTFYFPPLSLEESDFLRKHLRNVKVNGRIPMTEPRYAGKTLEQYLTYIYLYTGSFDELVDRVTVGAERPFQEPHLSAIAILSRYHLHSQMRSGPPFEPKTESAKLLGMFSLGAADLISCLKANQHYFDVPDSPKQTMKALNEFFRALLYYSAMLQHNRETPVAKVPKSMVVPSADRLIAVDTSRFHPILQDFANGLRGMAHHTFKSAAHANHCH